jgi:NAD(P)-dependent dehydrogenase (short-subunit alcohol dehydrogenase family)
MVTISEARNLNASFSPAYPLPVAVFLGGTSGIGEAMAKLFARLTKGNAHIIIIGRNKTAADNIIASFPTPPEGGQAIHEFVHCDATLMKNIDATTKDLLARLPKINFLILSPGYLSARGRDETEEGIDKSMALRYYTRFKFIRDLMPLLRKAKDAKEDAKVLSVLAAGQNGKIIRDDLALKKNYGVISTIAALPTYNDLALCDFASQEPDMAFTHIYPGLVWTPVLVLHTSPIFRPLSMLLYYLLYPFTISPEECADYMWYSVFTGDKGFFMRGAKGEFFKKDLSAEERKMVWEHSLEVTQVMG